MNGFKVVYRDSSGSISEIFFGQPFSSLFNSMDDESYIRMVFPYAHPGCQIVSISSCFLDDLLQ